MVELSHIIRKEDAALCLHHSNSFNSPGSYDHEFADAKTGAKIGELRVKPSSILWKSKSQQKYRAVSLDEFIEWIENTGDWVSK